MVNLADEARHWGVEPTFHDAAGNLRTVPDATLRMLIDALAAGRAAPSQTSAEPAAAVQRTFQGDGARVWGIAVQLYAVRSNRNWGIGDFEDLHAAIEIAAASGASAVGVNPLHALFLDRPGAASPYSPSSRSYLNPLYIAVDKTPDFSAVPAGWEADAASQRAVDVVDYEAVAKLKLRYLRDAYSRFVANGSAEAHDDFDAFRTAGGAGLRRYVCFEVLREKFGGRPWRQWPSPWRNPDPADVDNLFRREMEACGFFQYLQWVADRQLMRCQKKAHALGMSIGLYLDIAVGVDPCGADAWSNQQQIMSGFSVGAPPDEYNKAGQDWGLAPFHPQAVSDHDFSAMRALLKSAMRYAGAVRLDHALGLMRLFLIPSGSRPREGAYVHYPFERLLAVIADESRWHRCIFIGEDLGTVPEGFRPTAAKWGLWSYGVMMFERGEDGRFKEPREYPQGALATFNTHDLPTFKSWITGQDLDLKRSIGVDPGESDEARACARDALVEALRPYAGRNAPDSFAAVAGFLAATPARLVMVALEDLLEVTEQINIPGTIDEYPNWRQKLPLVVEQWSEQLTYRATVEALNNAGRGR